jgi:radical SAM protein with 4Fe4S-binding SPASM domain
MSDKEEKFKKVVERAMEYSLYSKDPSTTISIFPAHVHIEPTNSCNLRCVHCHQSSPLTHFTKARGMMDFEVYKKIIDEIKDKSEQITLDSQGEPTTHPKIMEMIEYAKSAGLVVNMLTNGLRLTEEYAERLIELKMDRVVFSFEGSNEELHERVRRRSNYYETLRNILYLMKRNCETGKNIFICMSMIRHRYTDGDVDSYRSYFGSLPSDTIYVSPVHTMSGSSPLASEKDEHTQAHNSGKRGIVCRMPWTTLSIGWDGNVCPCTLDYNEAHPVGYVQDAPLSDILNSERMQRFRQCHLDGDYDWIEEQGSLCATCNVPHDPEYWEYDLLKTQEYNINLIARQAKVLLGADEDTGTYDPQNDDRYAFCVSELARVEEILATRETGTIAKEAKRLRAAQLRDSAIEDNWHSSAD